jgi:hypothetical protein
MKKAILVLILVLVLAGVAFYFFIRQKAAPKAASLLPETTLLYVGLPNFPKSRQDFEHSQLYALWQEPEVQTFLEKPRAALREAAGAGKSDSVLEEFFQDRVVGLLQGEVFLAVTRINPPPSVQAGVVFGADVKNKKLEAEGFLKILEHDLAQRFPDSTAAEKRYLGIDYEVWQLTANYQVCHAFLNSLLVFTADENLLRDAISRFAKQGPADAKSLADSPKFRRVLQPMPAGHEAVVYINLSQLLGAFGPLLALAPQRGGFLQKFTSIDASATSMTFADGLVEDLSLVTYAGTNHVPAANVERRTLALTSPDTAFYSVHTADLAAAYRQTMDALAMSGNATLTSMAVEFDRGLNRRGIRFADDVLASIGPELAILASWREGAHAPDVAFVAEVKNADSLRPKFDTAMDALKEAAPLPATTWEVQSYLGSTLRTMYVGASAFSPSYAITSNFLIFSLSDDYTRALVAQSKGTSPTLVGNPSFSVSLRRVPASASTFTYTDLPKIFAALHAVVRANASGNEYLDFTKLPSTETLTKHLAPFVSATVDSPLLQTTTTFSTMGKPLTLVFGVAGALAAAQPWLAQLPEGLIPMWPRTSSSSPPARSQTAPSQTPSP